MMDSDAIRDLARALRQRAQDIRAAAHELAGHADGVVWSGLAADAMRRAARDRASGLAGAAGAHDLAADALEHHAVEVERAQATLHGLERGAHDVAAASMRVAGLLGEAVGS